MTSINILLEDKVDRGGYIVMYGGNVIYTTPVSYWSDGEDYDLEQGRREFADKFRLALELVDKVDDLADKLSRLGRLDDRY